MNYKCDLYAAESSNSIFINCKYFENKINLSINKEIK